MTLTCAPSEDNANQERNAEVPASSAESMNEHSRFFQLETEGNTPNRWTDEQRVFLCVLTRWFKTTDRRKITDGDRKKIFYVRFANHFLLSDEKTHINASAIAGYFEQLKRDRSPIWFNICIDTPFSDPEKRFHKIRSTIRKIARVLEFEVVEQEEDPTWLVQGTPGQRSKARAFGNCNLDVCELLGEVAEPPTTNSKQQMGGIVLDRRAFNLPDESPIRVQGSTSKILPFDAAFDHKTRQGQQIQPFHYDPFRVETNALVGSIGFRTWDETNHGTNTPEGFWAGDFRGSFVPSPSRNSGLWAKTIYVHLRPLQEPSAWISIWLTLMPAIHRLLRSPTSKLTIVDADYLARDNTSAFPKVYSARTAISQYRLRQIPLPGDKRYVYKGGSEFIVWQEIEKHAVISTLTSSDLNQFLQDDPDLAAIFAIEDLVLSETVKSFRNTPLKPVLRNRRVGCGVGRLLKLLELPGRFTRNTAIMIARNWNFVEEGKEQALERYLMGVHCGFYNTGDGLYVSEPLFSRSEPRSLNRRYHDQRRRRRTANAGGEDDLEHNDDEDGSEDEGGTDQSGPDEKERDVEGPKTEANGIVQELDDDAASDDTAMGDTEQTQIEAPGIDDQVLSVNPSGTERFAKPSELLRVARVQVHSAARLDTLLPSPPDHVAHGVFDVDSRAPPPRTPNETFGARFQTRLFQPHIEAHEERIRNGETAQGALRQELERFQFGDANSSSPLVGNNPSSPICLDDSDNDTAATSPFVQSDGETRDVLGSREVNTGQEGKDGSTSRSTTRGSQRSLSRNSFTRRRRGIESILGLSPYRKPEGRRMKPRGGN